MKTFLGGSAKSTLASLTAARRSYHDRIKGEGVGFQVDCRIVLIPGEGGDDLANGFAVVTIERDDAEAGRFPDLFRKRTAAVCPVLVLLAGETGRLPNVVDHDTSGRLPIPDNRARIRAG